MELPSGSRPALFSKFNSNIDLVFRLISGQVPARLFHSATAALRLEFYTHNTLFAGFAGPLISITVKESGFDIGPIRGDPVSK
jgi:hypothetical protein